MKKRNEKIASAKRRATWVAKYTKGLKLTPVERARQKYIHARIRAQQRHLKLNVWLRKQKAKGLFKSALPIARKKHKAAKEQCLKAWRSYAHKVWTISLSSI